jgi:hypothetical protein
MVILTIYTVGYNEVRPIDTPALNVITISLIVFGCTTMIFLTGALVQLITLSQKAKGAFFIVQINRRDGDTHTSPPATTPVAAGDGVVLIGRPNRSALLTSLFEPRVRAGVRG